MLNNWTRQSGTTFNTFIPKFKELVRSFIKNRSVSRDWELFNKILSILKAHVNMYINICIMNLCNIFPSFLVTGMYAVVLSELFFLACTHLHC